MGLINYLFRNRMAEYVLKKNGQVVEEGRKPDLFVEGYCFKRAEKDIDLTFRIKYSSGIITNIETSRRELNAKLEKADANPFFPRSKAGEV